MLRVLPGVIAVVLTVFCLVDLVMSPAPEVRHLPKWAWFLIILVPFAGGIAWLTTGRPAAAGPRSGGHGPVAGRHPSAGGAAPPLAPDDDPEFLNRIERDRLQQERDRLRNLEADLERRERELGRRDRPDPDDDGTGRSEG